MIPAYEGSSRQFVIAFDVGAAYSGASYTILKPGDVPKIYSVAQFPGLEHAPGATRIPSVLMYDCDGILRAVGAEASSSHNTVRPKTEGWVKAERFKLHLHLGSAPVKLDALTVPALPPNKTTADLYADLLGYLMLHAGRFIQSTHPTLTAPLERRSSKGDLRSTESSPSLWSIIRSKAEFVIVHPNSWEGTQLVRVKHAAVKAGLVPDTTEGRARIRFISEGEASLCYCIANSVKMSRTNGFIVANLGSGILDFSAYKIAETKPLRVDEIAACRSDVEGSAFVTLRAKAFIKHKLTAFSSPYSTDKYISLIVSGFGRTVKHTFRSSEGSYLITFGSRHDNDPENGIFGGKMRLSGIEVAAFFEPTVATAVENIKALMQESTTAITAVYIIGGFSANSYILSQLQQRLGGVRVNVPDSQTAKAVAEGAIHAHLYKSVTGRVSKNTYGILCNRTYHASDPVHVNQRDVSCTLSTGTVVLPKAFHCIIEKGAVVSGKTGHNVSLVKEIRSLNELSQILLGIWSYSGTGSPPMSVNGSDSVYKLCTLALDLSSLQDTEFLEECEDPDGVTFWRVRFTVGLSLNESEWKADVRFTTNGYEHRLPARILYDERVEAKGGKTVSIDSDADGAFDNSDLSTFDKLPLLD